MRVTHLAVCSLVDGDSCSAVSLGSSSFVWILIPFPGGRVQPTLGAPRAKLFQRRLSGWLLLGLSLLVLFCS